MEGFRCLMGGLFLLAGVVIFLIEVYGVFRLKYVLNRMHAAALGATLGLSLCMIGLMFLSGLNFSTVKMFLVILFLWFASPTASHMLARLETTTNENLEEHCEQIDLREDPGEEDVK